MNLWDIVVLAAIGLLVWWAVRTFRRSDCCGKKKCNGTCCECGKKKV